jgi:hypothetical protein
MTSGLKQSAKTRFYAKVFIPDENGCMLWMGAKNQKGYGNFGINNKIVAVHRFSYELHVAKIPRGMQVLHKCDVRNCIAPDHLFLGTQSDNMKDMYGKNRGNRPIGEHAYWAKLSNQQILEIRKLISNGTSNNAIAKMFGVTPEHISGIKRGKKCRNIK